MNLQSQAGLPPVLVGADRGGRTRTRDLARAGVTGRGRAQCRLDDLLIMAENPTREFGTRRSVAIQTAQPVKRSNHVALLLMGTFAIGGGAYALMPRENCATDRPGMASDLQPPVECSPHGSSSGGGHGWSGGSSSRSSFFGGDSSSGRSPSGASADPGSGGVTRGGCAALWPPVGFFAAACVT